MKASSPLIVFSVVLLNYFALVSTLSFTLPPGQEKCLREEVHKDVLVTGEYRLSEAAHQKTHLTVSMFLKKCNYFMFMRGFFSQFITVY